MTALTALEPPKARAKTLFDCAISIPPVLLSSEFGSPRYSEYHSIPCPYLGMEPQGTTVLFMELRKTATTCILHQAVSLILVLGLYRAVSPKCQLLSTVYNSLLYKVQSQRHLGGGESLPDARNKDPL